jgi:hypothetical protein
MSAGYLEEIAKRHAALRRDVLEDRTEEYREIFAARRAALDAAVAQHTQELEEIGLALDAEEGQVSQIENAKRELWAAIQSLAKCSTEKGY